MVELVVLLGKTLSSCETRAAMAISSLSKSKESAAVVPVVGATVAAAVDLVDADDGVLAGEISSLTRFKGGSGLVNGVDSAGVFFRSSSAVTRPI